MKNWQYTFIVFLGGCCYGALSTFVKLAYRVGLTPTQVTGGQYFFGTVLIWLLVLFTKKKRLSWRQVVKILASGIPFGFTGLLYYQSLQTLHASLAIIFLFQFVWVGAIFEWVFNKKKPSRRKLISIAVLLIGSVLAANIALGQTGDFSWQGMILGLLSAVTYTSFIFLSGSVEKDAPPVLKSALLSTGGLLVISILFPPSFLLDASVMGTLFPYGLVLGFFGVALPPLLFSIGLPHVGPALGTILSASELPMAVTMSFFILAEKVTPLQWLGVLLIIVAIIGGNGRPNKKEEPVACDSRDSQSLRAAYKKG